MNKGYVEELIEQAYLNQHNLFVWELDFLDNIDNEVSSGLTLTDKQFKVLERLPNK